MVLARNDTLTNFVVVYVVGSFYYMLQSLSLRDQVNRGKLIILRLHLLSLMRRGSAGVERKWTSETAKLNGASMHTSFWNLCLSRHHYSALDLFRSQFLYFKQNLRYSVMKLYCSWHIYMYSLCMCHAGKG